MKIQIKLGTTIRELKLGQLVSIGKFVDLICKERTDAENAELIECIDWITDLSPNQIAQLNGSHLEAITDMVFNSFNSICQEYGKELGNPQHYPAFTLIAKSRVDIATDNIEIEDLREQLKGKYFSKRRALEKRIKELRESHTPQLFRIKKEIGKESMALWVAKLDGVDNALQQIKPEQFYHQWQYIAPIIAMIAWRDGEQRTDVIGGKLSIDNGRIDYFSQCFLHLNAQVAVQIFSFFFSTKNPSFRDQFLSECLKVLTTPTQKAAPSEKSTENLGDGLATS